MQPSAPTHRVARRIASLCLLAAILCPPRSTPAYAQRSKDPLTADQEDQIREVADQPNERLKLYIKFIERRTDTIHRQAIHPDTQHPGVEIHDALQEFTRLLDELQDNLDSYEETHTDVRKSLQFLLDHAAKWPATLNEPQSSPAYDFARKTALEAVDTTTATARELLKSQEEYFAKQKPPKK